MKKIVYVSYTRFPSEKAHSLYLAKACEALAKQSIEVNLLVPRRLGPCKQDYKIFYGLQSSFLVYKIPCVDLMGFYVWKPLAYYLGLVTFTVGVFLYALFRIPASTYVVSNNALVVSALSFFARKRVVYEVHDYPEKKRFFYRLALISAYKIQTNNNQKVALVSKDFKVPLHKIYAAHNGVTVEDFDIPVNKNEARKQLGLEQNAVYAVYTGHLYGWKGVDTLAQAARSMPEVTVLFVGGTDQDIERMKKKYGNTHNVIFCGYKTHTEIPLYQKAADVLVVPNTAKEEISRLHTSPMKLFEYMASKRPIIASDIPSLREVLSEENATFVQPDNQQLLAKTIEYIVANPPKDKTSRAFADVEAFSWEKRACEIIKNLQTVAN